MTVETINNQKKIDAYIQKCGLRPLFSSEIPHFFLRHYTPGELLTTPFSPSQYLQFIVDGSLQLYNMPDEESTIMLQTNYNEVSLLGDMELLDSKFTPFFVEAKTDVYTLAFHLEAYRQQLLNDPAFLRYLCLSLANKLNGAVMSSMRMPLRQLVIMSLQKAKVGDEITNIAHLAHSLNVSPRQLLRVLKEFCELGILEHTRKGTYVVKKTEDLPHLHGGKKNEKQLEP
jgi:CRP-like cAMP-binding protein